jgi:hypothetical protein
MSARTIAEWVFNDGRTTPQHAVEILTKVADAASTLGVDVEFTPQCVRSIASFITKLSEQAQSEREHLLLTVAERDRVLASLADPADPEE